MGDMKYILCLIESLGSGGAERQIAGLAVMLKQHGFKVEVCYYVKKEFYLSYLLENGVGHCFLENASNPIKRFFAIKKHIREYRPDTVISYSASPSMIACFLKLLGAKFNLIVSERNTTQKMDRREKLRFFLYKWANHIVPNSQSQGAFIDKHYPNLSKKLKVITNYVDTDLFVPLDSVIPEHDDLRIICVGRLMPQKNILLFMEAISRVLNDGYNIHVDWYGQDLKDDYSKKCHHTLKFLNLSNVFVFHAPSSNIHNEYCSSDVFCLPSLYEGFPNVLCEAMSCGMAVLCSRICDNPNIVKEGENGFLFNPHDSRDIANIIELYLSLEPDRKIEMAHKGRERAVNLFSRDCFIEHYISIL